ncbi:MAG: hypothetical protein JWN41_1407 [Thermoleophilia bacterium]|nr:hypothetical protein [Thermoleophilia bacterium]
MTRTRSKFGGVAAIVVVGAALAAAGCGASSSSGGASSAAKSGGALNLVPKSAIGYATFDTDFSDDNWKQFDREATGLYPRFTSVSAQVTKAFASSSKKVDFHDDVDPWLGKTAGVALLRMKSHGRSADAIAWAEVDDRAKLEKFATDQGLEKGSTVGDYTEYSDKKSWIGVSDDLVLLGSSKRTLESTIKHSGDSISDADGVSKVAEEVGDDTLVAVVLSGGGVRSALQTDAAPKSLKSNKLLKDFKGASFGLKAEDKGIHVHGYAASSGIGTNLENTDNKVFKDLPGSTLLALGGQDLGGQLKTGLESYGKSNRQFQQQLGTITGVVGVDLDDLASAFGGEFALGVGADTTGLQTLVGSIAGAALGGGAGHLTPGLLAKSGTLTLAFENADSTGATVDKLVAAAGGLTQSGAPKAGTVGAFATKTVTVRGIPITSATSKDVSAISVGTNVFAKWGTDTLGDSAAFTSAWKAADAPSDVAASFWLDWPRISKLAGLGTSTKATPGGWVGWATSASDHGTFDLFMHVTTK